MEHVKAAALRSSPTPPGLPSCPVSQHLAGEEDTTDIAQTHRKTPVCSSHHGNGASFHVPCHCSQCRNYHEREHRPLAEVSGLEFQSQNSGRSHHQRVPQLLPSALNTEQKDSTKKVRSPNQTRLGGSEGIPDSFCIIDSRGRSLEPGDAVQFMRDGYRSWGIYVGGQEVVWSEETDDQLVYKGQLQLTDPFGKLTVINEEDVRVFPPEERVDRAKSRVGMPFTEGDVWRDGLDFPHWIFTGMRGSQAWNRGFWLWQY